VGWGGRGSRSELVRSEESLELTEEGGVVLLEISFVESEVVDGHVVRLLPSELYGQGRDG
jgi:hypothetical protein